MGLTGVTRMKKIISLILTACFFWILNVPIICAQSSSYQSPLKDRAEIESSIPALESYISDEMKKNKVLGLSIAIVKDDSIIYAKGFGLKDDRAKEPVDINSVFQAASLTKPITAYAALRLVQDGKLNLDEPLCKYIKRPYFTRENWGKKITLRMILTHTSGMNNDSLGRDRSVNFMPGTQFSYSGAGFRYLQQVIEDITGDSYERFVDEDILTPLDMTNSFLSYQEEMPELFAQGSSAYSYKVYHVNAAFSLNSTPTDYAKFLIELLNPTRIDPDLAKLMTSPCYKINAHYSWGLGVGIEHTPIGDAIWQWGNNENIFHAFMVAYKEQKTGVIVMTNNPNGIKVLKRIAYKAIGGFHYSYLNVIPD